MLIGIDVGGTNLTGMLAEEAGVPVHTIRAKTDAKGGAAAGYALILDTVRSLMEEAGSKAVTRIGIGFGGPVDFESGKVRLSHHVSGWENFPLRDRLSEAVETEVVLDNDCNAGAMGEWRYGAGRGFNDLLYVNIGTGIGGGVISGGRLVRGAGNGAGEIGHMVLDPEGPECTCGKRGCLESYCSGPSIARIAQEAVRAGGIKTLLGEEATSEEIFEAARSGDLLARRIVEDTARRLAHAIGNACVLINPKRVILGGGVSLAGDDLLVPVRKSIGEYVLGLHLEGLEIVQAENGYEAGVRGAVALAAGNI